MSNVEFTFDTLRVAIAPIVNEGSSRRVAERATVRKLVEELLGHDPIICHNDFGAPFIEGRDIHISISHSPDMAAVAVDTERPVGIDIESISRSGQIARVAPRVMSQGEIDCYSSLPHGLLKAWTMKEALYKVADNPGIDWRDGLVLPLYNNSTRAYARAGAYDCQILLSREILIGESAAWLTVVRQSLVP